MQNPLPQELFSGSPLKSALVTGATGFIGRSLVELLQSQGVVVTATVRPNSRSRLPPCVARNLACDLKDTAAIDLPSGIDTVFHLAGKAHALSEVAQDEHEYAVINTEATRRLLEAARRAGVRSFVYFSSIKAAADAPSALQPVDETWDAPSTTAYGRSKRAAERLVLGGGYVPHPVVLRPSLVYGAGAKGNLEKMITAIRVGRFPPLRELANRRSVIHVHDVCRAAIAAAMNPAATGRVYILTDGVPVSTRQLFVWMCAAVGRPAPRWTIPVWILRSLAVAGDVIGRLRRRRFVFDSDALARLVGSAWYSSARFERELDWRPSRTLRDSLAELVTGEGSEGGPSGSSAATPPTCTASG